MIEEKLRCIQANDTIDYLVDGVKRSATVEGWRTHREKVYVLIQTRQGRAAQEIPLTVIVARHRPGAKTIVFEESA